MASYPDMFNSSDHLPETEEKFLDKLFSILKKLRENKRLEFKRVLPLSEYLGDRWEKAQFLGFGKNSSVYDSSYVFGDVTVGAECWIGPFTILDGSGGLLKIGDFTHISAGVQIYTHDTVDKAVHSGPLRKGDVSIGNNCYIGPNAIIGLGVSIGDNVIIGANSFVNKDIPSHSKAYGTPAKIYRQQS